MQDYNKAQAHLARTGKSWNYPGKPGDRPAKVPTKWDDNQHAWDACMQEIGFSPCDDNRWCWTETPTETTFGFCAIVGLEDGVFRLNLTVDTVETEQDSPWVYPAARFATPLEAAKAAVVMFGALKATR